MKIYVLEFGEYSYRYVQAAFTNKAKAESLAELGDGTVTEFELDTFDLSDPYPGKTLFYVEMRKDGRVVCTYERKKIDTYWHDDGHHDGNNVAEGYRVERSRRKSGGKWRLHLTVACDNAKHAVKIANEFRAQILAGAKRLPDDGTEFVPLRESTVEP